MFVNQVNSESSMFVQEYQYVHTVSLYILDLLEMT